jgi:hypothetical protein
VLWRGIAHERIPEVIGEAEAAPPDFVMNG